MCVLMLRTCYRFLYSMYSKQILLAQRIALGSVVLASMVRIFIVHCLCITVFTSPPSGPPCVLRCSIGFQSLLCTFLGRYSYNVEIISIKVHHTTSIVLETNKPETNSESWLPFCFQRFGVAYCAVMQWTLAHGINICSLKQAQLS